MNEKGFSLIESIIAMSLTSLAVIIILLVYTNNYSSFIKETEKIEVQENLRVAMNRMTDEIKLSTISPVITDSANPGVSTDTGDRIYFKLTYNGANTAFRYYFDSTNREIQRYVAGEGNSPVASHIDKLFFEFDSGENSVTISITGSKGKSGVVELTSKVNLRLL